MGTATLIDRDRGMRALTQALEGAGFRLSVGVQPADAERAHADSGITIGELAALEEFGSARTVEHAMIRGWVDENRDRIQRQLAAAVKQVLRGDRDAVRTSLEQLAREFADGVRARTPVGETGTLQAAMTGVVEDAR